MKERPNLTQFMEQLIRALKEEERFSTAHIYLSTLNALRLFCKGRCHPVQPNGPFQTETNLKAICATRDVPGIPFPLTCVLCGARTTKL